MLAPRAPVLPSMLVVLALAGCGSTSRPQTIWDACGAIGLPCCGANGSCGADLACQAWTCQAPPDRCGGPSQPCCGLDFTCDPGLRCDRGATGRCLQASALAWQSVEGRGHTYCGQALDGRGYCWGGGTTLVGDGRTWEYGFPTPTPVAMPGPFDQLIGQQGFVCAIRAGELHCWGGTWRTPVRMYEDTGLAFKKVALDQKLCALSTGGRLFCSEYGYVTTPRDRVEMPGTFTDFGLATLSVCAVDGGGAVHCFDFTGGPVPFPGTAPLRTIRSSHFIDCGIGVDDAAYCWTTEPGACTTGTTDPSGRITLPGGVTPVDVQPGCTASCALGADHVVYCWGKGSRCGLGMGPGSVGWHLTAPTAVPGLPPMRTIHNALDSVCGVSVDGERWCWGYNDQHGLGDVVGTYVCSPVHVP